MLRFEIYDNISICGFEYPHNKFVNFNLFDFNLLPKMLLVTLSRVVDVKRMVEKGLDIINTQSFGNVFGKAIQC